MAWAGILVAGLLAASMLAGCATRLAPDTQSSEPPGGLIPMEDTMTTTSTGPSPETLNLTRDPVDIQAWGNLSNGGSGNWSWHVAPGYRTFQVELRITGQDGVPEFVVQDFELSLVGGDPATSWADSYRILNVGSEVCYVCHDGVGKDDQPGQWDLEFRSGPSAAAYTLRVLVEY